MALPQLSMEQKKAALKKAQEMRSKRRAVRERLKSGALTLDQVFAQLDDEVLGKMRVAYLLESMPKVGKIVARKIMQEIGIDDSRRLQGLGNRQKKALISKFSR